ncbi:Na+/H+ antiporter NhaA [Microbacterium sp.]|uniref:Na+/H+ antiporter NhaA n=1 Tax=Microbacterium sp. TaxID=51671 RepID=UPI0009298803|nr:Na+/H+ antiporter NhaA [Microbacterium sp.]MBN9186745.1 Na+/H+ antiporter NhaA [Microbacterium sp.]MBN9191812.1 Na+/H+ antiporter NhaA [Microbacterium sp.]OJU66367.1 MAG: sodium:proton antiporter [Microbacterium sp. 70-38]
MTLLRSARFPAILLLVAAALGLALANSAAADTAFAIQHAHLGLPGTPFDLSVGHWISDGLLAVFFFVVAVELQFELTAGELRSARRAVQPAIAALGGVIVPIAVYVAIAGPSGLTAGWPVSTATDIAFALGILAVFGRGLPPTVRVFLLALAILDDIVGILFIAVLFAHGVNLWLLGLALVATVAFGVVSRMLGGPRFRPLVVLLVVLALCTWALVLASGVHATIAGVLLGLAVAQQPGVRARHLLEPWVNGIVLPLFALSAALVAIPAVGDGLSPVFWGILVALPVGKLVGITGAGWLAQRLLGSAGQPRLAVGDLVAAGALGGVGFTVSLLLAALAFADSAVLRDEAILGVLAGSIVSLVVAAVVVSLRARHHRRAATAG